jgi:hypothetical protein
MMGVADVNGFVQSSCVCFRRDELFYDPHGGPSGTVNKQVLIDWLSLKILPLLGKFEKGKPHRTAILDNASIHMNEANLCFWLLLAVDACVVRRAGFGCYLVL